MASRKGSQLPVALTVADADSVIIVTATTPTAKRATKAALLSGLATQQAFTSHTANTGNPQAVTKTQVRLRSGCDNTADADKPVSRATQTALATKTAAYTLTATDSVILADATTAAFQVTLPTAVGITGRQYTIKKIDSTANIVTVDGNGSQTIDGATTKILASQWAFIVVVSDGANWVIVSQGGTVN